jgi:hypothetical protein
VPVNPEAEARPWTWCIPITDDAEALNARLLTNLLRSEGQRADVFGADEIPRGGATPDRVVVLACAPLDLGQLRRTLRAVRGLAGHSELAVHVAGQTVGTHLAERLTRLGVARVTTRLASLIEPDAVEPAETPGPAQGDTGAVRPVRGVRPPEAARARGGA